MMRQEQFEAWSIEFLRGELGPEETNAFEEYLKAHPEKAEEVKALQETWTLFEETKVPETTSAMDARFFDYLGSEIDNNHVAGSKWSDKFSKSLSFLFKPQLAYGALILGIGLSVGYFLKPSNDQTVIERTIATSDDTKAVREQLVLTLLEQPSANKRLKGVNEVNKIEKVDVQIMQALLQTLNNDPNVNVRLAAIESLTNYVDDPTVRQGLVQSIPNQESPIVQVTLANLMSALQEKKSIAPFKRLLQEKQLDTTVKKKIESTIQSII